MSEPITWTNERRKLSALVPWPRNPRQIKGDQVKRLQESLAEFGQVEPVAVGPGNELYNGHQRLRSWLAKYGDIEIDVRVASRPLTEKEREKLTVILHRGAVGEWDFDTLANEFDVSQLVEWGFSEYDLGIKTGNDPNEEWKDMPEIDNIPKAVRTIYVHFSKQEDVEDFINLLGKKITEKTKSIWYPKEPY